MYDFMSRLRQAFAGFAEAATRTEDIRMKPMRLATAGLIAAAGMFGALAAMAAPAPTQTPVLPEASSSLVTPVYYCCWWKYGKKYCSDYCGTKKRYRYYRYNY
jgi:hypothetical protein